MADAGPHPNPRKASDGKRLHRLEPDPVAAPVVQRIFAEYSSGKGFYAIAEGLTRDDIPSPAAHDPVRNRHRDGRARSKFAVRAILKNPRYTGSQAWNRQRRDEVLLDVDDVAAGRETKLRWNDPDQSVWSAEQAHEPLISADDFDKVQTQMAAGVDRPTPAKGRSTTRCYVLSGLVRCATCGRRMQGTWAHSAARYRCKFPSEYALANKVAHPKSVYVRESAIVTKLDTWLAQLFDPAHLDATCEALAIARTLDDATEARADAARRKIADCDQRLRQYRGALDSGADASVVAGRMAEVQGERLRAEQELTQAQPSDRLTKDQIRALVLSRRDIVQVLATADPKLKAEVYAELGVDVTYDHELRLVSVAAGPPGPCTTERVGEGTCPRSTRRAEERVEPGRMTLRCPLTRRHRAEDHLPATSTPPPTRHDRIRRPGAGPPPRPSPPSVTHGVPSRISPARAVLGPHPVGFLLREQCQSVSSPCRPRRPHGRWVPGVPGHVVHVGATSGPRAEWNKRATPGVP